MQMSKHTYMYVKCTYVYYPDVQHLSIIVKHIFLCIGLVNLIVLIAEQSEAYVMGVQRRAYA